MHASVHIICTETHMYLLGSHYVHAASVLYNIHRSTCMFSVPPFQAGHKGNRKALSAKRL